MTDNTATERLREMLDERGVKWWETINHVNCIFTWWESPTFGIVHAMDNEDGETLYMACLNNCDFTPEQAVAATLGSGTCECVAEYAKSPIDGKTIVLHRCSACHGLMRPHMRHCPNCGRKCI